MSPLVHLKRAFGWNLGAVVLSTAETATLTAAGHTDPVARRYLAWRRSLLAVAIVPTLAAFALAVVDTAESGFGEHTPAGVALEITWLLTALGLPLACLIGVKRWTRPRTSATILLLTWVAAFVIPFAYALLPVNLLYHVHPVEYQPPAKTMPADSDEDEEDAAPPLTQEQQAKIVALEEMAIEFVMSGGGYLLLLPAVLSLIPGAVNGCLRVKALLPAAQLPGWLLVCAAPAFLLFWLVILVIANHAAQSAQLVFGVILWAGSPIVYSLRGRVFVQSQVTPADAAKIGRGKKLVGLCGLAGIALLVTFVVSAKVAGLRVVGFDKAAAVATNLDALTQDDEASLEDVQKAFAESRSILYAFDLSSFRMVIDFLAKLLVVTAIFADLVLRAAVTAWRNDKALRHTADSADYDASAAALTMNAR
jgi:hypothetical protein